MLRFGVVVKTDPARGLVRVQFTDMDGEVSYWLAVLKSKTLLDKEYWMPDIGEHVVALIDDYAEEGVVLGAIYSKPDPVPVASQDKYHVRFKDGTWIEYDRVAHLLTIECVGDIILRAKGKITIDASRIDLNP